MKLHSAFSYLMLLAGVANAQYTCFCTAPESDNPDGVSEACCSSENGITFPDGALYQGTFLNISGLCQFKGLPFTQNQFEDSYAACCRATGPQDITGDLFNGTCPYINS
ncbi:hypothetical protein CORC01_10500 [Colletotrichum orchidophilum]|uniref:Hydrophobin n=1 Tax=Colletotrichum orchidophilum TaxID=1209926 RepID=A0A1G4AYP4_9PEZI|nr:uncharacterized protein CORC01_10500 [Colletotrichum orchidophilum]OHE94162.1 hypothetical protein CORC01_10500 [Colletotrichum orchidophilum]